MPITLPSELVLAVALDSVLSSTDLRAIALASRAFNGIAVPILYQSVEFDTDSSFDSAIQFLRTLFTNPPLALCVQSFTCSLGINEDTAATAFASDLAGGLCLMHNLRKLRIEFAGLAGNIVEGYLITRLQPGFLPHIGTLQTSSPALFTFAAHRPVRFVDLQRRRFTYNTFIQSVLPPLALSTGPLRSLSITIHASSRGDVLGLFTAIAHHLPYLTQLKIVFHAFWHDNLLDFATTVAPIVSSITSLADLTTHGYFLPPCLENELNAVWIFAHYNPRLLRITPVFAMWARNDLEDVTWTPRPAPFTVPWWIARYGFAQARNEMIKRWKSTGAWIPDESWIHARRINSSISP